LLLLQACHRRCCRCRRRRCRRRRRRRRFTDSLPCAMMVQCASRTSALRCVRAFEYVLRYIQE